MIEIRGSVESGIQDSGTGQTIAVTDGHEASRVTRGYSGRQYIIDMVLRTQTYRTLSFVEIHFMRSQKPSYDPHVIAISDMLLW